jgi:hypothetical protein
VASAVNSGPLTRKPIGDAIVRTRGTCFSLFVWVFPILPTADRSKLGSLPGYLKTTGTLVWYSEKSSAVSRPVTAPKLDVKGKVLT